MMTLFRRFQPLLFLCPLLFTVPASAAGYCESGKTVTFAGIDWESGAFITEVMKTILAKGYGCKTDTTPGNSVLLEQAVADNEVQIFAEEWVGRSDVWKRAATAGKVAAVGHPFIGAEEGWFVPTYLIEGDPARGLKPRAPDLKSVMQLSDPAYVSLFSDPEEPDKGRFLNCPSGFTCEGISTAKLEGYKLDRRYVNFRPGTAAALDAAITSSYLRGEPILFAYWSPSSIVGKLKLTKLAEPPFDPAIWASLESPRGDHVAACDFPEANVAYGVSSAFQTAAPEIIAILDKATFPLDEVNRSLTLIADQKITPSEAAAEFLKNRTAVWRGWVSDDAYAKLVQ